MGDRVLLVGCGKMGGAMLAGWLRAGTVDRVDVVEPSADQVPEDPAVFRCDRAEDLPPDTRPDIVVFAVKPQVTDAVVPPYGRFVGPETVFLSVAAGRTIDYFREKLGGDAAIIRVMPNTPAAIGRGASVLVATENVGAQHRTLAGRLLAASGLVEWVEDEALIDAVTALSGSGPAYIFLLIETMAKAGESVGLPADLAMRLARQTVIGSAALAEQSDLPPATLRQNVTSPGGTTQAALEVLMTPDGMQALFDRALAAAARRSRELAG